MKIALERCQRTARECRDVVESSKVARSFTRSGRRATTVVLRRVAAGHDVREHPRRTQARACTPEKGIPALDEGTDNHRRLDGKDVEGLRKGKTRKTVKFHPGLTAEDRSARRWNLGAPKAV